MHDLEFELGAFSEPWELEAATADDKTRSRLGGGTKTSRTAVERKGNITKVPFWAHIGSQASSALKASPLKDAAKRETTDEELTLTV